MIGEVIRKADVRRSILLSVGFLKAQAVVEIVIFKYRYENVKDSNPRERAADVTLPTALFCFEV